MTPIINHCKAARAASIPDRLSRVRLSNRYLRNINYLHCSNAFRSCPNNNNDCTSIEGYQPSDSSRVKSGNPRRYLCRRIYALSSISAHHPLGVYRSFNLLWQGFYVICTFMSKLSDTYITSPCIRRGNVQLEVRLRKTETLQSFLVVVLLQILQLATVEVAAGM